MNLRHALTHALTAYDAAQSRKPGYNLYALPQYLARIDAVMADIEAGAEPRAAIMAGFTGTLQRRCLKAAGLPPADHNHGDSNWWYTPVALR